MMTQTSEMFSNATGANFLLENAVKRVLEKELLKYTNQQFYATPELFGIKELAEGKFKSLTITGSNIIIEGVHASYAKIQTLCGFNQLDLNSKPIKPKENMVIGVWAEFTADDLRKTIEYKNYSHEFSKIDLSEVNISAFSVYSQTIAIEDNKLYFTINAKPSGPLRSMDIAVESDIKVQNGQVLKSRFNFVNLYTGFDLTQLSKLFSSLNNLNFTADIFNNKTKQAEIQIMDLAIVNNKLTVFGIVFIPKI